jgi:nitrite reductase/ring-hydroxylating ferredoxin subunit
MRVRTEVLPTRLAAGQLSAWKAACAHFGLELGSPPGRAAG